MMRYFLIMFAATILIAFTGGAAAEPLNYDYIYLSAGKLENDDGTETSGQAFGAFYSFTESSHGFIGIDNGGSYAAVNGDSQTIRAGYGGHFFVTDSLIIAPAFALLRTTVEWDDPVMLAGLNTKQLSSHQNEDSDTGYALQLDARWNFAERWELIGGLHRSEVFDEGNTELVAGILWHPLDWLALGAVGKERSHASMLELTGRWYFGD